MRDYKAIGAKAKATNLARDPDWYSKIGRAGGLKSRGGGFTGNSELASKMGKLGGSRRGKEKR